MQLDISARLTPQVTIIICHHMKKILLKEKRKKKQNTKKFRGIIRPKLICLFHTIDFVSLNNNICSHFPITFKLLSSPLDVSSITHNASPTLLQIYQT